MSLCLDQAVLGEKQLLQESFGVSGLAGEGDPQQCLSSRYLGLGGGGEVNLDLRGFYKMQTASSNTKGNGLISSVAIIIIIIFLHLVRSQLESFVAPFALVLHRLAHQPSSPSPTSKVPGPTKGVAPLTLPVQYLLSILEGKVKIREILILPRPGTIPFPINPIS